MKKEEDWLYEELKTAGNLCEIARILIDNNRRDLLPTILEITYELVYHITEEHCIMIDETKRTPESDLAKELKEPESAAYFANAQAESAKELLRCGVIEKLDSTSLNNKTLRKESKRVKCD